MEINMLEVNKKMLKHFYKHMACLAKASYFFGKFPSAVVFTHSHSVMLMWSFEENWLLFQSK